MRGMCIPISKFGSIRISVIRDITKIWKKNIIDVKYLDLFHIIIPKNY